MTEPRHTDDLAQRYLEASAQDPRRPPDSVRDAVRAHALDVIAAETSPATASMPANMPDTERPAANQSRWKLSLLASVALAGITGLLVLQFERGTTEEKDLALGQPAPQKQSRNEAQNASRSEAKNESVAPATAARAPAFAPASAPVLAVTSQPTPAKVPTPAAAQGKVTPQHVQAQPQPQPESSDDSKLARPASDALQPEPPAPASPAAASARPPPAPAALSRQADAAADTRPIGATTATRSSSTAAASGAVRAKASTSQDLQQAMMEAARTGNTAQIETLLQQGAALNAADEGGRTALIWAVMNNQSTTVERLLALGANKTIKDREGLSALQHARRLNLERMVGLLEARS